MFTLPEVTLVGTLVADPELRFTPNGKAVANFNIACNSRKKNDSGQWEDGDATFLRGTVWGEYAENVAESLTKGLKVIVRGQLKQRSYEKDGQKRTVYELDVEEIGPTLRFATARVNKASRGGGQQQAAPAAQDNGWGGGGWGGGDEEPPF